MSTVTTETLAQEYTRLADEQAELQAAARREQPLTLEMRERYAKVTRRLREIGTLPPAGYELPKLASDLVAHAEAHGWMALVQWTPPDYEGEPSVTVQVGRILAEGEMPDARGDRWIYKRTWHSRGCPPGQVRLFGRGHAVTPDNPGGAEAPSVKVIRAVITQHPKPEAAS
jgi:hypothetical protein